MEIFAWTTEVIGDEEHFCIVVKGVSLTIAEQTILRWSEYFYAQALERMAEEVRTLHHSCRQEAIKYLMPFAQELAQRQAMAFVMMTESMLGGVGAGQSG
ncbi:hypothetical protein BLNAU_20246 [Blattamonas nauphoetae]|uniref:Uncharacterized protein n=1 Tax=Blattamonas nauphoetae TaxID=2049346 RepID=A0ABQ9X1P3_9EUKA|nr:hypothetical protein BLNAU_20246 [Blattamonas nauphoetae]